MTPGKTLAELESLAGRLGIAVRTEPFGRGLLEGRGGLCWIDGKPLVVMDEKLSLLERIGVLAAALAGFNLDGHGVSPALRERITEARARRRPKRGKASKRPGLARAKRR